MRYQVTLAYDGTDFSGWQIQPGLRTVQQCVSEALAHLAPNQQPIPVYGSGRTDAGVHAEGQVIHFDLERTLLPVQLRRALNCYLPPDIRALSASPAEPTFDARRSALGKEYRYRIWNDEVYTPLQRRQCAHVVKPLNLEAIQLAAQAFVGEHDFAAFTANPSREVESTVRKIFALQVVQTASPRIEFHVMGNGFLYKMVRSIAGFLIAVGKGHESPHAVSEVLASCKRTARVETAPPQGLSLWHVWYRPEDAPSFQQP